MYPSARPAPSLTILRGRNKAIELKAKQGRGSYFYILACRIGPLFLDLRKIKSDYGSCWWILMVMNGCEQNEPSSSCTGNFQSSNTDLLVCDSKKIEKYIQED